MTKARSLRPRPLKFWFTSITRSPAQESACKDLRRNGHSPTITPQATYTPTPKRAGSRSHKKSRRLAGQKHDWFL
ncbi:Malolactic regulator [Lacticaseibacillus rhamnosus]|nr:Malolactic regulator [Lacticaseibacillus rhamnosus]